MFRTRRRTGLATLVGLAGVLWSVGVLGAEACPAAARSAARPADSGVRGTVTYGPTCPVERVGQSCTRPYEATIRIRRAAGGPLVATARSDRQGRFRARLAPGRYRLEPVNGRPYPRAAPQTVTVSVHRFTSVSIRFDSGIR